MSINMRSKLYQPDLPILANEICKAAIECQFNFWVQHIRGKKNAIADRLCRFHINPFVDAPIAFKFKLNTVNHLQRASDLANQFNVNIKNCILKEK